MKLGQEANLLSFHRVPLKKLQEYAKRITTDFSNEMWGNYRARVFTLKDGWGWIFVCLENWKAECTGIHVTKHGDGFAALELGPQTIIPSSGLWRRELPVSCPCAWTMEAGTSRDTFATRCGSGE